MKKFRLFLCSALIMVGTAGTASAEKCANCGSGSSSNCKQCSLGDKDTSDGRKRCEKMGCKISGTGSCSTAANVKVCG